MAKRKRQRLPSAKATDGTAKKKKIDDETDSPTKDDAKTDATPDLPTEEPQPFKPKPMADGRSLLLELPPELRDIIYEMVLDDAGPPKLSRTTSHRQIGVNKQVRDEFFGMLFLVAPTIHTTVRNFNFSHIVTWLNRLSEEEVKKMEKKDCADKIPAQRCLKIELFFTSCGGVNKALLQRWLNRVEHPTKKGTKVDKRRTVSTSGKRSKLHLARIKKAMADISGITIEDLRA